MKIEEKRKTVAMHTLKIGDIFIDTTGEKLVVTAIEILPLVVTPMVMVFFRTPRGNVLMQNFRSNREVILCQL